MVIHKVIHRCAEASDSGIADRDYGFEEAISQRDGAEAQIRTGDTGLFRAVLYQLSYLGALWRGRPDLNRRSLE